MTPAEWRQTRELFEAAIARPERERRAFVIAASAAEGHSGSRIRDHVLAMLEADDALTLGAGGLVHAAPDLIAQLDADAEAGEREELVGTRVGSWQLLRPLGHGGMGAVYLAERFEGDFKQRAAVKLVRPGWDAGDLQRRFREERRILAGLDHPRIAHLIDGGETPDGKPYLVMEYVDGQPLCAYCDDRRLTIAERLQLFLSVCAGVAHAHRNLVVHRDIKPSNILVSVEGEVKLLDFGIARLLEQGTDATGTAMRLFTPEYAAPEQVRGDPITTSADVYALGLVLFELLAGGRPYGSTASTPDARQHAVLTKEPVRPSQLAQSRDEASRRVAALRRLEPRQLAASLRGDLDAIVLKALRKEPQQRYPTVEALSEDIQRHLKLEPVAARRGTWRYQSARFLRRHWLATAMGAVALGSLLTGLGLALWQAENARRQQSLAEIEAGKARAVAEFMTDVFKAANPTETDGHDPRASALLAQAVTDIDSRTDLDPAQRAGLLLAMGRAYLSLKNESRALDLFVEARRSALRGGDASSEIETRMEVAAALNNLGRPDEALREMDEVRRAIDAQPHADRRFRKRFDNIMAIVLQRLDRPAEALTYVENTYRTAMATEGAGTAAAGEILEVYTVLLVEQERIDEAVEVARLNHEASRRNPRLSLIEQASFASASAFTLLSAERYADAEAAYRESLEIRERIFGAGHVGTASSMHSLATMLYYQGRFTEAAGMYERVLAIHRAQASPNRMKIAGTLSALGEAWRRAGARGKAIEALREGLAVYEGMQHAGAPRPSELALRVKLARTLEETGAFPEAIATLTPMLDRSRTGNGARAGAAGVDVRVLHARLLARAGSVREGCSAANEALESAPDGVDAVEARILVADCEWHDGHAEAAKSTLDRIDASTSDAAHVSEYARTRLAQLRRLAR